MKLRLETLRPPEEGFDLRFLKPRSADRLRLSGAKPRSTCLPSAKRHRIEDRLRLERARKLLKRNHPSVDSELLAGLIRTLSRGDGEQRKAGSASDSRWIQVRLTGAILRLLSELAPKGYRAYAATVMSLKWVLKPVELTVDRVLSILREFEENFRRKEARGLKGHLIGRLDGEFDVDNELFVLHFHCVCTGEMAPFLRARVAKKPAYRGNDYIVRPVLVRSLDNPAYRVSYISKTHFVKGTNNGLRGADRVRYSGGRVPEPYGSHYLSVLNAIPLSKLYVFINVAIRDGVLVDNLG